MYAGDELKDMLRKYLFEISEKLGGQLSKEDDKLSLSIKEKVKKEYKQLLKEYRNLTL